MKEISDYIDLERSCLRDARSTQGEAVILLKKPDINDEEALAAIIEDFKKFTSKAIGRSYSVHRDSYSNSYRIFELGRENYGFRISDEGDKIIIKPIGILEDLTILKRYLGHLKHKIS
ncbi:MAG: hypothetical protein NZ601_00470 [candidate division WOR-3 bacterium]|nr:hypothetical protein [candidate division WOR-3 bacterium]MCX7757966.1 hypothetical protein [candidate division WOR-3 bacterium]MDW7987228.1 hypothetical protein [candidate division WOR-3 bacterium]